MRFTELRETVKPRCCSSFVIARSLSPSLCKRLNKGKGTDLANNGWRVRTKFILLREISTVGCKLAHCCCMGKRMLCFNMGVALKKDGRARSKEERKFWVTVALRARYMPSLDQNVAGAGKQNKVHAQKTKNCTRISPRIFRAPCPIKTGGAQNGGGGGVGGVRGR